MIKKDMENSKKMKEASLESYKIPYNLHERIQYLEGEIYKGKVTHEKLTELLELYSIAAQYYSSINNIDEFNYYLNKIKSVESSDLKKDVLVKRKSKVLSQPIKLNNEDKKQQIQKIKKSMKQSEKNHIQETNNIIENFTMKHLTEELVNKEIENQSDVFKKRMEEKKMLRNSSHPVFNGFKNRISQKVLAGLSSVEKILPATPKKRKSILSSKMIDQNEELPNKPTPLKLEKRTSILKSQSRFSIPGNTKKLERNEKFNKEMEIDVNENKEIKDKYFEEIFEKHNKNIELHLNVILEKTDKIINEKVIIIEEKIESFIEEIINEKLKRMLEINEKYDKEIKETEVNVDFNDENNINNIIFNGLQQEKSFELKSLNDYVESRKNEEIKALRELSNQISLDLDKTNDLQNCKTELEKMLKVIVSTSSCLMEENSSLEHSKKNCVSVINCFEDIESSENLDLVELKDEINDKVGALDNTLKPKKIRMIKRPSLIKNNPVPTVSNRRISSGNLNKFPTKSEVSKEEM